MPFLGAYSSQDQALFGSVECPDDVDIPLTDIHAHKKYPILNWVYDKVKMCEALEIPHGFSGVEPEEYPVFQKPIHNLEGRGQGTTLIKNPKDEDSLDRQLALLKATKCSIYGASGAAVLPFFVNTPTFTQQTAEEGFRLKYKWERDLTDNLKNIKIFDKYCSGEDVYNSSPDELFEEFEKFYRSL